MNAPLPPILDRASVVSAIAEYLLDANHDGYQPNTSKVLSVRKDRLASLREVGPPVRGEVSYFIEGELFAVSGQTRLAAGETVATAAERLVGEVWDRLWVWNAYDFARSTSGWRAP